MKKILIVEDMPTQATSLKYILESANYIIDLAFNGKEAIEKANQNNPDMFICDIVMPDMDGFELCRILKSQYPDKPCMLLTQLRSSDDIINGIDCGADNFINKLSTPDFVIQRVKELFDNFSLNKNNNVSENSKIEVILQGKKNVINSNNSQILNLLISTFENAVEQNKQLQIINLELQQANEELERINSNNLNRAEELSASKYKYKSLSESLEVEVNHQSKIFEIEKKKLISILTNAPAAIATWKGPEHIFEFANVNYLKTFGYRELLGKSVREALPEIAGQGIYELLDDVYNTGKPFIGTEVYTTIDKNNDGNLQDVYWNFIYQPVYDENKQIVGVSDFAFDVTEQVMARKKVEELNNELSKSESQYKELAESLEIKVQERTAELLKANKEIEHQSTKLHFLLMTAQAAICLLEGPQHVFTFTNSFYEEQFGKDLVGKPIREALPIYDGQGYFELLDNVYKTGKPFVGKESPAISNKNGIPTQCYYDFIYQPVYSSNGNIEGISAFIYDVTEQVTARNEMEKLNHSLNRSNESLQSFAYIASHDLQEPLRMINSYSQLLVKRYKDKLDENANDYLGFIQDGTKRMKNLIDDILNYSKISKKDNTPEKVNINQVIEDVKSNLQLSIDESNATLNYENLPDVSAEKIHILQLFQNIIGNAIKYRKKDIPLKINILSKQEKNKWMFSISDNGIGISKENSEKVFEVFRRLHSRGEYEGTGIGLANCKKIVELYDGRIWVDSTEGEGSTFFFTLPV